jgi:hypothetical protein
MNILVGLGFALILIAFSPGKQRESRWRDRDQRLTD